MQRFMYKRFIKNNNAKAGEPMGTYHKTVMADSLNIDLKDNQGTFNCGKPAGYVKDFKSLPVAQQDLLKQIKRVRVIFGLITLENTIPMIRVKLLSCRSLHSFGKLITVMLSKLWVLPLLS
jgi:hypothetical protein